MLADGGGGLLFDGGKRLRLLQPQTKKAIEDSWWLEMQSGEMAVEAGWLLRLYGAREIMKLKN